METLAEKISRRQHQTYISIILNAVTSMELQAVAQSDEDQIICISMSFEI